MSLAGNLQRMNRETSSRLSAMAGDNLQPAPKGRTRILAAACGAFCKTYLMQKNFVRGKAGFIVSCEAAIEALVRDVKVWELAFRRAEGGNLPPSSEDDVNRAGSRYASWTSS